MNSRVIYTAIVGNIDALSQPRVTDPSYDYICFVRKGSASASSNGVWQIREIPADLPDNRMLARYAKLHPHILVKEYEWSLWMDGNLFVADGGFYRTLLDCIHSGGKLFSVRHPLSDCSYEEAYACIGADKESFLKAWNVVRFLDKDGLPRHCGLCETGLILRSHNDAGVIVLDELWWSCLKKLSIRDQLSFMWCARKAGVQIGYLLPEGKNVRNSEYIGYTDHQPVASRRGLAYRLHDIRKRISQFLLRQKISSIDRKQCRR